MTTETKPRSRAKPKEPDPEVVEGEVVELPPEIEAEERGLVTIQPAQADHHIVTGMAALARMNDADYESAITSVIRGMERVRDFQQRAMTKGEDYGIVKGIERPFLHLPGAEKLCLLYGLAARQEAERIIGEQGADGTWLSPPLTYHVKTYVHLGSFDGPIVAMGYGEASSWEIKYRYTWSKPKCERCGKDLMKGGNDGKMAGKWFCPGFKGGCWWSTDMANVAPAERIENPDPWSLAETLIQMGGKRSFVAATRRATGTSGLFTQDEDSPSVLAQTEGESPDAAPPEVEAAQGGLVTERSGGKTIAPSQEQITRLGQLSHEKDLGPTGTAAVFTRVTGIEVDFGEVTDRGAQSTLLLTAIMGGTADQLGAVIHAIETGEVPDQTAADVERADPVAYATHPDDVGAK